MPKKLLKNKKKFEDQGEKQVKAIQNPGQVKTLLLIIIESIAFKTKRNIW